MAIIVKRAGHKERFDEKKVYASIYAACASAFYSERNCERTADNITRKIEKYVAGRRAVNSSEIRRRVENELRKIDKELAFFYEQHLPNLRSL